MAQLGDLVGAKALLQRAARKRLLEWSWSQPRNHRNIDRVALGDRHAGPSGRSNLSIFRRDTKEKPRLEEGGADGCDRLLEERPRLGLEWSGEASLWSKPQVNELWFTDG